MRKWIVLAIFGLGAALAASESLTLGLWAKTPGFTLGPTLKLEYPVNADLRLDLYLRASLPGTDETSAGFGFSQSLEGGVLGRGAFGARAFLGVDTQYWLEAWASAALGKGALDLRLGYTENRTPRHFWPLERETLGLYADLDAKYRLDRRILLLGAYRYQNQVSALELALSWREPRQSFLVGAGAVKEPTNAYALLGYRTREGGAALGAELRIGSKNELKLDYAERAIKAHLALAYPPAANAGVVYGPWALDALVDQAGFEVYLRYTLGR